MLRSFFLVRDTNFGLPANEAVYGIWIWIIAITAQFTTFTYLNVDEIVGDRAFILLVIGLVFTVFLFILNTKMKDASKKPLCSYGRSVATMIADILFAIGKLVWVPIIFDLVAKVQISDGTEVRKILTLDVKFLKDYGTVLTVYLFLIVLATRLYYESAKYEIDHIMVENSA